MYLFRRLFIDRYYIPKFFLIFFFNDPATTEIYTLSLHDALPISVASSGSCAGVTVGRNSGNFSAPSRPTDRKSTRLNSSHVSISYAVFCLKKKKKHSIDRFVI